MGYDERIRKKSCYRKGIMYMKINLKSLKGTPIVTINGKPMVFATLTEALKYICGVKR